MPSSPCFHNIPECHCGCLPGARPPSFDLAKYFGTIATPAKKPAIAKPEPTVVVDGSDMKKKDLVKTETKLFGSGLKKGYLLSSSSCRHSSYSNSSSANSSKKVSTENAASTSTANSNASKHKDSKNTNVGSENVKSVPDQEEPKEIPKKKIKKDIPKLDVPVPALVDRPSLPERVVPELPEPIRCSYCGENIQPKEEIYYTIECEENCLLHLQSKCLKKGMEAQNLKKKRDYKGSECLTDGCEGENGKINIFDMDNNPSLFFNCSTKGANVNTPVAPLKEKKKDKKKDTKAAPVPQTHQRSEERERKDSESSNKAEPRVQAPQPYVAPVKRAVPLPVELYETAKPIERKDEFIEKYGSATNNTEETKKKKKEKNTPKVINVLDEHISAGAVSSTHPKAKNWKSEEDVSSASGPSNSNMADSAVAHRGHSFNPNAPTFERSNENFFPPGMGAPGFGGIPMSVGPPGISNSSSHFSMNNDIPLLGHSSNRADSKDKKNNMDWVAEEIEPFKNDILANLPYSGPVTDIEMVIKGLVPSDNQAVIELERIWKSEKLTRNFLKALGWFVVSKSNNIIMYKKKSSNSLANNGDTAPGDADVTLINAQEDSEVFLLEEDPLSDGCEPFSNSPEVDEEDDHVKFAIKQIIRERASAVRSHSHSSSTDNSIPLHSDEMYDRQQRDLPPGINYGGAPMYNMRYPAPHYESPIPQPLMDINVFNPHAFVPMPAPGFRNIPVPPPPSSYGVPSLMPEMNSLRIQIEENQNLTKDCERIKQEKAELEERLKDMEKRLEEMAQGKEEAKRLLDEEKRVSAELQHDCESRVAMEASNVQVKDDELRRISVDVHVKEQVELFTKRKKHALSALHHLEQIFRDFQQKMLNPTLAGSHGDYSQKTVELTLYRDEWKAVYDHAVEMLVYIEQGSDLGFALDPPPMPNLPQALQEMYSMSMNEGMKSSSASVGSTFSEIQHEVAELMKRYGKPMLSDSTLRSLIVRYEIQVSNRQEAIDVQKCVHYICNELSLPVKRGKKKIWSDATPITKPAPIPAPAPVPISEEQQKREKLNKDVAKECPICMCEMGEFERCVGCKQAYDVKCIRKWLREQLTGNCPNCRHVWPDNEAFPSLR